MFVSEIMSTCVAECTEDTRLEEVFERIRECEHGLVVVVDSMAHRVPIGVVTERSICEQIIARGRNPKSLAAGSVIDPRIKKVKASDLVEVLFDGELGDVAAVLVVDDNRRACGVVSKAKLVAASRAEATSRARVTPAEVLVEAPVPPSQARISEIPAFGWIQ